MSIFHVERLQFLNIPFAVVNVVISFAKEPFAPSWNVVRFLLELNISFPFSRTGMFISHVVRLQFWNMAFALSSVSIVFACFLSVPNWKVVRFLFCWNMPSAVTSDGSATFHS